MKLINQKFSVPFEFSVHFTTGMFEKNHSLFADIVKNHRRVKTLFVIDQGVADKTPSLLNQLRAYIESYSEYITLPTDPLVVPGGEIAKNDQQYLQQVLEACNTYGIDRHSYIIGIGGGALLDMVGFAAAIAHRGIRHIRIPTTVLAQNDSGIGVKNGINAFDKKNFLGTFAPPYAVINDNDFLRTLNDRDWRSGISEAVKVALIKDAAFYKWIEANTTELSQRDLPVMSELIFRCAKLHMEHIGAGDPFEMGSSRPLDFGHWAAHKLEQLSSYQLRHGEAVAIGICLDVTYSYLKGMISHKDFQSIIRLFQELGFEVYHPALSEDNLWQGLEEFREHLGGQLTVMLLSGIGEGVEVNKMEQTLISKAADQLKEMASQRVGSITT